MKKSVTRVCIMVLAMLMIAVFCVLTSMAEEQNYQALASKIVSTSASIKPGDVVVVAGGKHNIPLMEALAIEAQKAGGLVTMFLNTDRVIRSLNVDVPEQFISQEPTYFAEWLKHIDVYIALPAVADPKAVSAGVPQARFAKYTKAGRIITNMLNDSKVRLVSIGYPTEELAAINQLDFQKYEKMHWEAVDADYKPISEKGKKLQEILHGAKRVKVTSSSGTDLTFSIGDRPIFISDGIAKRERAESKTFLGRSAFLPSGQVFLAPIETSANGKVVVPKDRCRFAPMSGVSLEFKNGKMENFKADKGAECFKEVMAPYTGDKDMFSNFSIGLNPAMKVIEEGGDFRPVNAAGMVYVGIGDNQLVGGKNKTHANYNFPVVKATVEVDGKVVIKDGKLVF